MDARDIARRHYQDTDPLKVRVETHQRYEERRVDLDEECREFLRLSGDEAILDVGCGPGTFLVFLRRSGHRGHLVGLDQSLAMTAEAVKAAMAVGVPIEWLAGDACAVPFAGNAFARVVARHMLYHVPDIPQALREFGRVLDQGGALLVTTNSERTLPRIAELFGAMQAAFGLAQQPPGVARFSTENAMNVLQAAHRKIEERVIANALVFTSPEPIVRYVVSCFSLFGVPEDAALRREMERWLIAEASRRLAQLGGVWRDPKAIGLYRCELPREGN